MNYFNRQPWLVWNPEDRAPRYQHSDEQSARTEAARLARLHPGQRFLVMKPVAQVVYNNVNWTEFEEDRIPGDGIPF